jgi:peptidyl-prolyl cis-trans isomerase SurA
MAKSVLAADPGHWRTLAELAKGEVIVDSGRIEWSQIPGNADHLQKGYISPFVVNKDDQAVSFVYVLKLYPQSSQKSFDDAKGQLMNDYQNELESKWISELKKKYPVKINTAVVEQTVKQLAN